jgi:hypothetical protein
MALALWHLCNFGSAESGRHGERNLVISSLSAMFIAGYDVRFQGMQPALLGDEFWLLPDTQQQQRA